MNDAAEQRGPEEPLPSGSGREQHTFQGLVFSLAEALRCYTVLLDKPPSPDHARAAGAAFAALVVLKKSLRTAQLAFPLIRPAGRPAAPPAPVAVPPAGIVPTPQAPDPVSDAMGATAWLLEAIHQLLAMPNRLTREQRVAALELSDALTDFVPIGAQIIDRAPE